MLGKALSIFAVTYCVQMSMGSNIEDRALELERRQTVLARATAALTRANHLMETGLKMAGLTTSMVGGQVAGLGPLLRAGIQLPAIFDLNNMTRIAFIEHRCLTCGDIEISCKTSVNPNDKYSQTLHYVDDIAVLKFRTSSSKHFLRVMCSYKKADEHGIPEQDVYGGQALKEEFNYYQIRAKGVYRWNREYNAIDMSQSVGRWEN